MTAQPTGPRDQSGKNSASTAPVSASIGLRRLGELVELAPVGILVRTFTTDEISYWSRGAEQVYGWSRDEAIGQVSHKLLKTEFPVPLSEIDVQLRQTGSWSGELIHTNREGRKIVVASRQTVQRDDSGNPVATLEINTDLSRDKRAEEALRQSEERFRLLVDNIQDYAVYLISPEGLVETWNQGAQRLKGYTADEIIGEPYARFFTPEDIVLGMPEWMMTTAASTGRVEVEGWRVRKDGGRFWANGVLTALRDPDGTLRGFAKVTRDLTERMQAEEARLRASREEGARAASEAVEAELRASRDQLAAILAGVAEGITVQDASGNLLYANDAAARLCGFDSSTELLAATAQEVVSRFELFDERGKAFPLERLPGRRLFAGHQAAETLVRFRRRGGGEDHWSLVNATAVKDESGEPTMVVSIFHDVTDRKRAEDAARLMAALSIELTRSLDYEETLRRIAELSVPSLADWCVVDVVEDGEPRRLAVAHVNPEKVRFAEQLTARYPPEPNARTGAFHVMRTGQPQLLRDITDEEVAASARDSEHLAMLRSLQLRSAIVVPLIARGRTLGAITLIASESGRRYDQHDLEVAQDLALRAALAMENARLYREAQQQAATHVELNAALRAAMLQLQQALQTRDEFLAAASHDLKNPVASIKGTAQLLLRRLDRAQAMEPDQLRASLQRIDAIATRAGAQLDELLDAARLQMGRPLDLDRQPTDLVALARQCVDEHQQRSERHEFVTEVSVPELVGFWDPSRLTRAVGNLLDNAVKYSPDGGTIHVRVMHEVGPPEFAVLEVSDHGVGILPEDMARIFERFHRGANVVGQIAGTGIGLASSRHIVESHGGSIAVQSRPGRGSTFTLRLPLGGAPNGEGASDEQAGETSGA